ncbi:hypothetical protein Tco_1131968, partial [Tanacetum coccineum]
MGTQRSEFTKGEKLRRKGMIGSKTSMQLDAIGAGFPGCVRCKTDKSQVFEVPSSWRGIVISHDNENEEEYWGHTDSFYKKTARGQEWMEKRHVGIFDNEIVVVFIATILGILPGGARLKVLMEGPHGRNCEINWVESRLQMRNSIMLLCAFTVINELVDCGMSSTVKIGYTDIPLYSRFKQVEYKGVPHPLSGDYTLREQEDINDSLYEYGKYGPQPQSPSPTVSNVSSIVFSICPSNDSDGELGAVSDANSTVYSTCQSNDSDGEQGTISDHSVKDDPIPIPSIEQVTIVTQKTQPQVPKPQQIVDPSCAQHVKTPRQPIRKPVTPSPIPSYNRQNWNQRMERNLGEGYSFVRKPCFVCGSLSHLIKDCDYYEKKMARQAALKRKRVVHVDVRQATPAWTNTNRVNKANQFTPRPVQLSNIRPNLSTASNTIKTDRVNVNTGHGNVNPGNVYGTPIKSGSSRFNTGKLNVNSGSVHVNSARVTRPVSNQTSYKTSPKLSQ